MSLESELKTRLWFSAVELVSLDFIRAVYRELGIGIPQQGMLREIARDSLAKLDLASQKEGSSEATTDIYNLDSERFLSTLESCIDGESRRLFEYWVHFTFNVEEKDNPWLLYQDVIESWASTVRRTHNDPIRLQSVDSLELAMNVREELATDGVHELLIKNTRSLSEWDLPRFLRNGFSLEERDRSFIPYVDHIELIVSHQKFQNFWRRLAKLLSAADFEVLLIHIRHKAEQRGDLFTPIITH